MTGPDSIRVGARTPSGAGTAISYSSRDSMKLSISGKVMRLYGDAEVIKGAMRLTAGYIEIDFRTSELTARAVYDSATRQYVGIPVFKDATQEFSALSMRYNFRTGKGITEAAETHAWVIGWQADIAFAVFVENGGSSSDTAVPVAEAFLRGL